MYSLSGTIIAYEDNFAKIQTKDCRIFHVPKSIAPHGIGEEIRIEIKTPDEQRQGDIAIKRELLLELIN
ncbi:MAG: hypothetical protein Q8P68_02200 [Candidatus Peregrinibacteria bacterium]|nr:hypothetical protein [Candidatus Peregrinibacteria bacterium]MDZ4245047.1 hypothetical protein [Candidatus Gracilibacteria bacterium]